MRARDTKNDLEQPRSNSKQVEQSKVFSLWADNDTDSYSVALDGMQFIFY